jgi:hypothetical protein
MKKKETQPTQFVVCLDNEGYKASLEIGKLYRVIPDDEAEANGYIRVVDESGEDYAFRSCLKIRYRRSNRVFFVYGKRKLSVRPNR